MSAEKAPARRYLDYSYITLIYAVEAPPRGLNTTSFSGEKYKFFVEHGMFCIECRETGVIIDVPQAQIRVAKRAKAKPDPVKEAT